MRLSVLALFIALPTAAYAAVYPRQDMEASTTDQQICGASGYYCSSYLACCSFDCSATDYVIIHLL